jgi:hypothetical protein
LGATGGAVAGACCVAVVEFVPADWAKVNEETRQTTTTKETILLNMTVLLWAGTLGDDSEGKESGKALNA